MKSFYVVLIALCFWSYVYIGMRAIQPLPLKRRPKVLLWLFLAALFVLIVAGGYVGRSFGPPASWYSALLFASNTVLGFVAFLLFGFLPVDVLRLLFGLGKFFRRNKENRELFAHTRQDRRRVLLQLFGGSVVGASTVATSVGVGTGFSDPIINTVPVSFTGMPSALKGFRIVQITDLHLGGLLRADFFSKVVQQVNAANPDVIAITGDFADAFPDWLPEELDLLKDLRAKYGVFYVTGNHEYYWDAAGWCAAIAKRGVTVLRNEHRIITIGDAAIAVAGVHDYAAGRYVPEDASDPRKALSGAKAHVKVLLAHQPKSYHAAKDAGFDLMICGHTHGGQFIPFNLIVALVQPFVSGLYKVDAMQVYVSTGTGFWGPPMRLGVPAEIAVIEFA